MASLVVSRHYSSLRFASSAVPAFCAPLFRSGRSAPPFSASLRRWSLSLSHPAPCSAVLLCLRPPSRRTPPHSAFAPFGGVERGAGRSASLRLTLRSATLKTSLRSEIRSASLRLKIRSASLRLKIRSASLRLKI